MNEFHFYLADPKPLAAACNFEVSYLPPLKVRGLLVFFGRPSTHSARLVLEMAITLNLRTPTKHKN